MGIELYFSNRTEILLQGLCQNLSVGDASDPFEPAILVIPNANMKKWLQIAIAKETGIAMNLRFSYLESTLWELLDYFCGQKTTQVAPEVFFLKTLEVLHQSFTAYEPFFNYVRQDSPGWQKRLFQLCQKLSFLMREYEYHREDMVDLWRRDQILDLLDPVSNSLQRCYQRVYKEISSQFAQNEKTLFQYTREIFSLSEKPKKIIHIFGLSQVSAFHIHQLDFLKEQVDFHIYVLNPCAEFWEDIPFGKKWQQRRESRLDIFSEIQDQKPLQDFLQNPWVEEADNFELDQEDLFPGNHGLLSLWGRPGRENMRLLCQLTDYNFHELWEEEEREGFLFSLQNSFLHLNENLLDGLSCDQTLRLINAPSKRREIEWIHKDICEKLSQDPHLLQTDFVILVPDITVYSPLIQSVFLQTPKSLEFNIVDTSASLYSFFGSAIQTLLQVCEQGLSRQTLFELIHNPCIQMKFFQKEDSRFVASWIENLHIYVHEKTGSSEGVDLKDALERLCAGRVLEVGSLFEFQTPLHVDKQLIYQDSLTTNRECVDRFAGFAHTLLSFIKAMEESFLDSENPLHKELVFWFQALLEIPLEMASEFSVRYSFYKKIEYLEKIRARELDKNHILDYVSNCIQGITGGIGDYLTGGVSVSSLQPMRPIPFRHIYVAGLEEGDFPGIARPSSLDLRMHQRRIGDVSLAEKNRYLFLEILLCARESLTFCMAGLDLLRDQKKSPCSLIEELCMFLQDHKIRLNPLNLPFHGVEETGKVFSLTDQMMSLQGSSSEFEAVLKECKLTTFQPKEPDSGRKKISLDVLSLAFLKESFLHPVLARAKLFGVNTQQEDVEKEIEIRNQRMPVEILWASLEKSARLQIVQKEILNKEEFFSRVQQTGFLPAHGFEIYETMRVSDLLDSQTRGLSKLLQEDRDWFSFCLGKNQGVMGLCKEEFDALKILVADQKMEIHAQCSFCSRKGDGIVLLFVQKGRRDDRYRVEAFLCALLMSCFYGTRFEIHILCTDGWEKTGFDFTKVSQNPDSDFVPLDYLSLLLNSLALGRCKLGFSDAVTLQKKNTSLFLREVNDQDYLQTLEYYRHLQMQAQNEEESSHFCEFEQMILSYDPRFQHFSYEDFCDFHKIFNVYFTAKDSCSPEL